MRCEDRALHPEGARSPCVRPQLANPETEVKAQGARPGQPPRRLHALKVDGATYEAQERQSQPHNSLRPPQRRPRASGAPRPSATGPEQGRLCTSQLHSQIKKLLNAKAHSGLSLSLWFDPCLRWPIFKPGVPFGLNNLKRLDMRTFISAAEISVTASATSASASTWPPCRLCCTCMV